MSADIRQTATLDLEASPPVLASSVRLSAQEDEEWSSFITLPPGSPWLMQDGGHHDIYIVSGSLLGKDNDQDVEYGTGDFVSRAHANIFFAGTEGAMLFSYHDGSAAIDKTVKAGAMDWQQGGAEGMEVVRLLETGHRLMLVSWQPGTRMHAHRHPRGEEILVLQGTLKDELGSYPRGSWQRLPTGSLHSPYADEKTLILLRNGHLGHLV